MPEPPKVFTTHGLHPEAEAMIAAAGRLAVASGLDDDTLVREAADAAVVIVQRAAARLACLPRRRACARPSATAPGST